MENAYEVGRRHYREGRKVNENPYQTRKENVRWCKGWYYEQSILSQIGGREL